MSALAKNKVVLSGIQNIVAGAVSQVQNVQFDEQN
jgi:hypothetical protein